MNLRDFYKFSMIHILSTFLLFMGFNSSLFAQPVSDIYKVLLVSNIDDIDDDNDIIEALLSHINKIETPFALVVNGDFSKDPNLQDLRRLTSCIAARPDCRMIILQGDRDWANSKAEGWENVLRIEKIIRNLNIPNVLWMNSKGCPGPEIITLDNHVQFIGINTQWFNHPYSVPTGESGDCSVAEEEEFYEELEDLIDDHSDQNILICGHFPILSNGPYGGRYPLKDWIFPIPIISGFFTSYKQNVGGPKEIDNEEYTDFAEEMLDIVLARSTLIYSSGHDRHTEFLLHGDNYLINSGAMGKTTPVKSSRFTAYKSKHIGFTELIYIPDGEVKSRYWNYVPKQGYQLDKETLLFQAPCENPVEGIPVNDRFIPCAYELPVLSKMTLAHANSAYVTANSEYAAGPMRKLFLGQHYRSSWTTPIQVPLMNMDTVAGGLIPYSLGGGRQTKSLKFRNEAGEEYVFRSVDKDPTKSLTYDLRNTVIDIIFQDQTTTQHPYGALTVPPFLKSLGVLHANPKLYVLPDDPKLGPWRREFGGMLGMLEERPTNNAPLKFAGADEIKRSVKMFRKMYNDRDNYIDREEFLRARMLDIFLGDWGRHEDNWKWAGYDEKKGTYYRPIPRDRDHAFSKWDGILPWLADRKWAKSSGENFDMEINDIRSLTWQNRHMDRFLLSEADRDDWINGADLLMKIASEEKINEALSIFPDPIREIDQKELSDKLTERSKDLVKYANKYYDLLSKEVDIVGSNKHELFTVNRKSDGRVEVTMHKLKKNNVDIEYYRRMFLPDETKEIRLFGLGGKDKFEINGDAEKSILVRVIPGLGKDSITDESDVKSGSRKTKLYIAEFDKDIVNAGPEVRYERHAIREAYDYDREAFHYNTYLPLIYVFYNSDRGLDVGGLVTFTNYKYGKDEFSSKHLINARASTNGNLSIKYEPRWNDVFGEWDLVGRVEYEKNKNFNYYFGEAAFEPYDEDLLAEDYYTLRYSTFGGAIGVSHEFWENAELSAQFAGYYNSDQRRENTIADDLTDIRGLEMRFNTQLELLVDFDLRDRNDLPRMGYRFLVESIIGTDLQSERGSFMSGRGHIEMFNTFHPFTLGLRLGGLINEGDVPYFLNQYLGRNTYLRGFRQNRFLGDKNLFANSDLRIELVNTKKAVIPFEFGLKFFFDAGKTYLNNEELTDSDWSFGYGGGFYLVPYKERLTINLTAGFSEEESLLIQFKLGKPF